LHVEVSRVVALLASPRSSWTYFGCTFLERSAMASVSFSVVALRRLLKHTVDIGPGERYDVIWEAREPGKRCALYEVASTLEPRTRATNP
jgi:hypothetical protein